LQNEEKITDEEASYFHAMGKIIKMHERLIEYGSIEEEKDENQGLQKVT
jgi:hypothetical protein